MSVERKVPNHAADPLLNRFLWEVMEQSRTSVPAMLGMLLYKVPWLLSLRFVGNIGSKELAAAALATTLCNVTGMSLSVGLSSALTTLTGQAQTCEPQLREVDFATAEMRKSRRNQRFSFIYQSVMSRDCGRQSLEPERCDRSIEADCFSPVLAKTAN